MKRLARQPLFLIGFTFIFVLLAASILYSLIGHDYIPEKMFAYQNGQIVKGSPLSPFQAPPLGTDQRGQNLAVMLLIGAKYTLGIVVIVTIVRMILSFVLGWIYSMYLYRYRSAITGMLDGLHFIPTTLLAFVILNPILTENGDWGAFSYSLIARQACEIVILAIVVVPVVSLEIGNHIGEIRQRDFITSAKVLGANRWQVFWRDIFPHLKPTLSLISMQQVIQVMILLVHLGVLNLFFGGTLVFKSFSGNDYHSVSDEWSGLIGLYSSQYAGKSWLFLGPIIAFTLTIAACNCILEGIKRSMGRGNRHKKEKKNKMSQSKPQETVYSFQKS